MTQTQGWKELYSKEIQQAEDAQLSGNEGRARVCARRAAGIVIGEYLSRIDGDFIDHGAYDNLRYFITLPDVSPRLKEIVSYFVLRVDVNHELPIDVDLIEEALKLKCEFDFV